MFSSLRLRLILSYLAVICLAMLVLSVLLLSLLERYLLQSMQDSLIAQGRITAQALIPGANVAGPAIDAQSPVINAVQQSSGSNLALQVQNAAVPAENSSLGNLDLTYLTDASLQLSSQLDTRIRIVDAQGTVLVDTHGDRGKTLRSDPFVAQALNGQYASRVQKASEDQGQIMEVVLPVLEDKRVVGTVYLSQPLRDVTAVLNDLRARLLISTLIALIFSTAVGLLLSQAIARPVRQLTTTAETIARSRSVSGITLQQRVPVRSSDELGRLSRAFNEMLNRLQAAHQMQTDFVADVSHELRTPLTSIKGMLETLRDGAMDDLEVRDRFMETMEGETDRLARLVNDLLTLSKADSQALNLQLESVDLSQLARDAIDRLQSQADARQVNFQLSETTPILVRADPHRIAQVLDNLLINAVQYSHAGGTVTIGADVIGADVQEGGRRARLTVQDEGIGISADDLPRIGQRFYRADKARSRSEGGSGLGLAIARALVEAHGGQLTLESQDGRGTKVSFSIPLAV